MQDHFNLILNEPAGQIAQIIVKYSVERIVQCWSDPNVNQHQVIEDILGCLHHPDFRNPQCKLAAAYIELTSQPTSRRRCTSTCATGLSRPAATSRKFLTA